MRRAVGLFIDGELYSPATGERISPELERSRAVAAPVTVERNVVALDPLDEVAELLAQIIKTTQHLDAADQRRARELDHAASSALAASTVLDPADQRRFNSAIRRNSK